MYPSRCPSQTLMLLVAVTLGVALPTVPAQAAGPRRSVAAPTAATSDVTGRLDYVEGILLREQRGAAWWSYGWLALFSTAFSVQGTLLAVHWDKQDSKGNFSRRRAAGIQLSAAGLGVISQSAGLLPSRNAQRVLAAYPRGDTAANAARLAVAEQLLYETHTKQGFARGLLSHLGSAVVATYTGVMLGVVFDLPTDAAVAVPMAVSVGIGRIYTMPVLSWRGWSAYKAAYGEPAAAVLAPYLRPRLSLAFTPALGGVAVHLHF